MSAAGVDVWRLPLGADDPVPEQDLAALLDTDELRRAARLMEPGGRRRFVRAHGLTRLVLARYTRTDPRTLAWSVGAHGKPGPVGTTARPVHWNLSHSGDHALLAVSPDTPLGVDVQAVPRGTPVLALARRFLLPEQYAEVAAHGRDADRRTAYYRALCRTEAWAKAEGGRLLDALRLVPDRAWLLRDLRAPDGCVAALAVPYDRTPLVRRLDAETASLLTSKGSR